MSIERTHIAILGRCNAGKSTLVNRITGQDVSIVSDTRGTTTDPVQKNMEINGLGATTIIDTPGIDDDTLLGNERVTRIHKVLDKADIAVVLIIDEQCDAEKKLLEECRIREIPVVVALAHTDSTPDYSTLQGVLARYMSRGLCPRRCR